VGDDKSGGSNIMRVACVASATILIASASVAEAQTGPVIDVHVHAGPQPQALAAAHDSLRVRFAIVSGLESDVRTWATADSSRFFFGLMFPCEGGLAPITGTTCFNSGAEFPDTTWLRGELRSRRIRVLGEMLPQFMGMSPNDARLEPYWRLAEEFDVPVAIHMGPGPRAIAYDISPVPHRSPNFRMGAGDPLLLEDVLLRHKRLRLYIMHAGWPRLESLTALLYAHPNVYVDVGALQFENVMSRAAYLRYLRELVESGFGQRIMFGSDFSDLQGAGIEIVQQAEFLTIGQKRDILCNNAVRFFRLGPGLCDG
jgi:hypothetical protein